MCEELLMLDSTNGDGKAEIVMDYIISYTLRSSVNSEMPQFKEAARFILFKLLNINDIEREFRS